MNLHADSVFRQPRRHTQGLSSRNAAWALLGLSLIPLLVVLGLIWQLQYRSLIQQAERDMAALARQTASAQAHMVEGTRKLLATVSSVSAVTGGDWVACKALMTRLNTSYPTSGAVGILDKDGVLVCQSESGPADGFKAPVADRSHVLKVVQGQPFVMADTAIELGVARREVQFAHAVFAGDGSLRAVAFAELNPRQIEQSLRNAAVPRGMSVAVTDGRGVRLASAPASGALAHAPILSDVLVAALRQGRGGLLGSTEADGRAYLHHIESVPVGGGRLQVAVSASVDDLVRPHLMALASTMAVMLGVLLLYAAGVWQLGQRWLLSPLDGLANRMKEIELGVCDDTDASPLPPARVREISVLQHGLQTMWDGLKRRGAQRDAALANAVQAREELQSVIQQMGDGFLLLDCNWRIKFCNRHIAEMVHREPRELEGRVFWSLFADDTRRNVRSTAEHEILHGRPFTSEDFHGQHRRWLERKFFASEDGIGVIVRDTTKHWELVEELRARERRYSDMFEANPNVMWMIDAETMQILAVNAAAIRCYGYTEAEFLALRITDMGPEDDREQFIEDMLSASDQGSLGDEARIWRHHTKRGELMLVDLVHHAVKYKNRPARLVMATDVTSRLTAESKLRGDYAKLVRRYDEATRALLAARQVINGHVAMLNDDVLPALRLVQAAPPVAPPEAGRVRDESQRVTNLVEEAMQLTRIGRAPFARSPLDLSGMAEDVLARLAHRQPARVVHVDVEPGLRCRADPDLLLHLLEALLDNAWKFTERQANAWIRVGCSRDEDGRNPSFYVSDNGVGFDEAEEDKLYVPLARLASAGGFAGHGFGLAKAHAVVSRHGGRIWCKARPGQGATFHFELESLPRVSRAMVAEVVIDSVPPWED